MIIDKGSKGAGVSEGSETVNVSKAVPAGRQGVVSSTDIQMDATIAFKPFENSIYDLRGFLRLLDDLILIERSLFRGKDGTISSKARDFANSTVISIFEDIEKAGVEPATDAKQLNFLKDLVAYLKKLPVVKVTLAFSPTNTYLEKMSNSLSVFMNKKTILDAVVDEHIVGGAVFEYGGKISESTLEAPLGEFLSKQITGAQK